jgi:hypothetical protein
LPKVGVFTNQINKYSWCRFTKTPTMAKDKSPLCGERGERQKCGPALALRAEAWSLSEAEVLSSPALQDYFFSNWKKKEEKKGE